MYKDQTQNYDPYIHEEYLIHDTPFVLPQLIRLIFVAVFKVFSTLL